MGKFSLRVARPDDAGMMLALYAPYVLRTATTWEFTVPTRLDFASRVEQHLDDGFPWLVAEEDGAVLGYAYAGRLGARRGFDWDTELSIYLAEDVRGRHIGTALYVALLTLLKKQGYCNCYALITHPNDASESFHRSLGFVEVARLPQAGFKAGEWLDLSYYQVLLCPLPASPTPPVPLYALEREFVNETLQRAARLARAARKEAP